MYIWHFFFLVSSLLQLVALERCIFNERDSCSNCYLCTDKRHAIDPYRTYQTSSEPRRLNVLGTNPLCKSRHTVSTRRSPESTRSYFEHISVRDNNVRNNHERTVEKKVYSPNIAESKKRLVQLFREVNQERSGLQSADVRQNRFVKKFELNSRRDDTKRKNNKQNVDTKTRIGNKEERQYGDDKTTYVSRQTKGINNKVNEINSLARIMVDRRVYTSGESERRMTDKTQRIKIHRERSFRVSPVKRATSNLRNFRLTQDEKPEERFNVETISRIGQRLFRPYAFNNRISNENIQLARSRSSLSRDPVLDKLKYNGNTRSDTVRDERHSPISIRERDHLTAEHSINQRSNDNTRRETRLDKSRSILSQERVREELSYNRKLRDEIVRNERRSLTMIRERKHLEHEHSDSKISEVNTRKDFYVNRSRGLRPRDRVIDKFRTDQYRRENNVRNTQSSHILAKKRQHSENEYSSTRTSEANDRMEIQIHSLHRLLSRESRERDLDEMRYSQNRRKDIVRNLQHTLTLIREMQSSDRTYSVIRESGDNTHKEIRLDRSRSFGSRERVTDEIRQNHNTLEDTMRNEKYSPNLDQRKHHWEHKPSVNKESKENAREEIGLSRSRSSMSRERSLDEFRHSENIRQVLVRNQQFTPSRQNFMHRYFLDREIGDRIHRGVRLDRSRYLSRQRFADDELRYIRNTREETERSQRDSPIQIENRRLMENHHFISKEFVKSTRIEIRSERSRRLAPEERSNRIQRSESNITNRRHSIDRLSERIRYPTDLVNKTDSVFIYNLEYLFYVIQGIYLFSLFLTLPKKDGRKKKSSIPNWITSINPWNIK